jgi:trehalose-phosphatase
VHKLHPFTKPQTVSLIADKMLQTNLVMDAPTLSIDQALLEWEMTTDVRTGGVWEAWMNDAGIIPILKRFSWTTGGSVYRNTPITTLWDYTRSDPEWGHNQANHLVEELEQALNEHHIPVVVKHTKSTVQLLPRDVNKGAAATHILDTLKTLRADWTESPDFCLCLGDDLSDELMFGGVHRYFTYNTPQHGMFTSTVGRKPTAAQYYVRDVDAVHSLLDALVQDFQKA